MTGGRAGERLQVEVPEHAEPLGAGALFVPEETRCLAPQRQHVAPGLGTEICTRARRGCAWARPWGKLPASACQGLRSASKEPTTTTSGSL